MTVITETGTTTMKNYVGGQWVDAEGAELHDVINPATGEAIARVPFSSAAHLDDAVRSAREALPAWRGVSTIARARMLFTLREKLEARKHEIARLVAPQPLHGADHGGLGLQLEGQLDLVHQEHRRPVVGETHGLRGGSGDVGHRRGAFR